MTVVEVEVRRLTPKLLLLPGLAGGLLKLLFETAVAPAVLLAPWAIIRRTAGIVLGWSAIDRPDELDPGVALVGLGVHLALSLVYGAALVPILRLLTLGRGIAAGVIFGLVLYLVNFYGFSAIFPWFVALRGPLQLVSHALFGGAVAATFEALRRRQAVPRPGPPDAAAPLAHQPGSPKPPRSVF